MKRGACLIVHRVCASFFRNILRQPLFVAISRKFCKQTLQIDGDLAADQPWSSSCWMIIILLYTLGGRIGCVFLSHSDGHGNLQTREIVE